MAQGLSPSDEWIFIIPVAAVLAFFLVPMFRAIRKSRRELRHYRRVPMDGNEPVAPFEDDDTEISIEVYEEVLAGARKDRDRRLQSRALNMLGNLHFVAGDADMARIYYTDALIIDREDRELHAVCHDLCQLGKLMLCPEMNQPAGAIEYLEEALELAREIGDCEAAATAMSALSDAHASIGHTWKAIAFESEGRKAYWAYVDQIGEALFLWRCATIYENLGKRSAAIAYAERALKCIDHFEAPFLPALRHTLATWRKEDPSSPPPRT
jgi:tetratricopeptide (TPR) repeat protein